MKKRLNRDYLFSNPNISELEHVLSYSERHHIFSITIMCIKYNVSYRNGAIVSIDYHEDYMGCFAPASCGSIISKTTKYIASLLINQYLEDHKWLKGWSENWEEAYKEIWLSYMQRDSLTLKLWPYGLEDSLCYYHYNFNKNNPPVAMFS